MSAPAAPPLAGRAARLAAVAVTASAVLVPLGHFPGLHAPFLVPKAAALELCAALALSAFALHRAAGGATGWAPPLAAGAALVLLTTAISWAIAAGSSRQGPYALEAILRWGALFGLAAGASVAAVDRQARQSLLEAVTAAAAVVSAIGLVQHLELFPIPIPVISAPGSTFGNRNLAAEAVAMSLPLAVGAWAGATRPATRRALALAAGLAVVYLAATRARGAWLGAAAGLLTAGVLLRPRLSRAAVAAAVLVVVVAVLAVLFPPRANPRHVADVKRFASAADVAQASFDPRSLAFRTRAGLWRRTLSMWRDHPLFGVGPGNWPVLFPRYAEPGAAASGVLSATLAPRQAHDDLLERAAETGAAGLAALLFLAVAVVVVTRRRLRAAGERSATAAAAGSLVALIGAGITGFPLQMPATIALGGLALGLLAGETTSEKRRNGQLRLSRATAVLALVGLIAVIVRGQRQLRGSHALGQAERALRRDHGKAGATAALAALDRARAATPNAFSAHLRTSQMMLRLARFPEALAAARAALTVEPHSPNAWAALAAAQLAAGDVRGSQASAAQALALLHDFPFALHLAARAAEAAGDRAGAAIHRMQLERLAAGSPDEQTAEAARALLTPPR